MPRAVTCSARLRTQSISNNMPLSAVRLRCAPRHWHIVNRLHRYTMPFTGRRCLRNATHGKIVVDSDQAKHRPDEPELHKQTVQARRIRNAGLRLSLGITVCAAATVAVNELRGTDAAYAALAALRPLAAAASVTAVCAAAFFVKHDGNVHLEWHDGRLWIEAGVPPASRPAGHPVAPGALKVSALLRVLKFVQRVGSYTMEDSSPHLLSKVVSASVGVRHQPRRDSVL
jgi:hypothetical protein